MPFTRNPSYAHTHGAQADLQSTIQNLHAAGSLADTLQTAADGVVTGLGYKLACVNLVQPDGDLVVAAFSGNPAAEALITGRIGGRASWERRLSMGERWGELRFIPHHEGVVLLEDDVPQWHTEGPEPRFEDEWHPRDRLYAPMYSPGGDRDLLGVISVDWPRDGRRPDPEQRGNLAAYAAHAAVAIANARLWANSRRALVRLEREQQALRASEESFRQAFEYAPSGMAIAEMGGDQHGRLVRTNDALCRLLDRSASAIRRYSFSDLVHPEDIGTLLRTSAEGGRAELRLARRDNSYVWVSLRNSVVADATDGPRFLLTHVEDIEERKRNELQLAHRASHDTLTGLPNSAELLAHLASLVCEDTDPDAQEDMWAPGNTYQPSYADYDHQHLRRPPASSTWPKRGHAILICQLTDWNNIRRRSRDDADTVLIETTRRLSAAAGAASLGPAGAVYRSDIDEFLILAPDIDPEGLKMLVDQIRAAVGDPPPDALWHRPVTARWGVGWVECGTEGAELLRSVREGLSL
ncbi:PAS domain S-box protein [Streptomyces sp. NPDC006643]|uniref:GGDEF domain-containing protein n=1 Tax=Streptomyces sp. NPDC006643 TaxID=3364756 RepID=UPI0036C57FC6